MALRKVRRFGLVGGQVNNVNPLLLQDGEVELLLNANTDDIGVWKKRSGTKNFGGQMVTGKNVLGIFQHVSADGVSRVSLATCNDSSNTNSDIFKIISSQLNGAITTSTTTITVDSGTDFASSGFVEIEGDLIKYTGKSTNDLTGVTQIAFAHVDNSIVRQWKISLTNDTQGLKTRFKTFLDRTIRVNGTDVMKVFNGTSWATTGDPINPNDATSGGLIEIYSDRIFLAGNSNFPDRVYASSIPSLAGNVTWTTKVNVVDRTSSSVGYYFDVNPKDGQNLKALERNGKLLLIFKERALYVYDNNSTQADTLIEVGTISQESVVTVHNITFFLGRSKKNLAVYAFTGGYPKNISRKIKKWIDAIDQATLVNISLSADEDHVYIYIGNVTVEGRAYTDVQLVYNISKDEWSVYDKLKVRAVGYITSSGAEDLYFGDNNGITFRVNDGVTDDSGNTANAIAMEIVTKEDPIGSPELPVSLQQLDVFSQNARNISVQYRYNRGEWANLGQLKGRFTVLNAPQQKTQTIGETIQYKFSDASAYQSQIDGFVMIVDTDKEVRKPK